MDKLQFLVLITLKASHEFAAAHTALLPSEIIVALLRLDVLTVRSPVSELASFITTHTHARAYTAQMHIGCVQPRYLVWAVPDEARCY